jgi:hypothetical protein
LTLGVLAVIAILAFYLSLRSDPPRHRELVAFVEQNLATLKVKNDHYLAVRSASIDAGESLSSKPHAILGDGIAGAAAAINIRSNVRMYGSPSYWTGMHGVPEVWQTGKSLSQVFKNANLLPPEKFDRGVYRLRRVLWLAIENSRLTALNNSNIEYTSLGPYRLSIKDASTWRVEDVKGYVEEVSGPLVIATGVGPARTIVTAQLSDGSSIGTASDRYAMLQANKLLAADDYLANPKPKDRDKTILVLGAGGSAADVVRHAISEGEAKLVVVWGEENPIEKHPAWTLLKNKFGKKICRLKIPIENIMYAEPDIKIGSGLTLQCRLLRDNKKMDIGSPDKIIESLGRLESDPPPVLAAVMTSIDPPYEMTYEPIIKGTGELIGIRVELKRGDIRAAEPVFLIGAAASWIPEASNVRANKEKFKKGRDELLKTINTTGSGENPPPGFAASAFMGSELARQCFANGVYFDDRCK